jgi:cysteine desulfurase
VDGNLLLMLLDNAGFACSSGSACKVGTPEPSDVLKAIGLPDEWATGSLRITLGKDSQPEHIEQLCAVLPGLVQQTRALSQK